MMTHMSTAAGRMFHLLMQVFHISVSLAQHLIWTN